MAFYIVSEEAERSRFLRFALLIVIMRVITYQRVIESRDPEIQRIIESKNIESPDSDTVYDIVYNCILIPERNKLFVSDNLKGSPSVYSPYTSMDSLVGEAKRIMTHIEKGEIERAAILEIPDVVPLIKNLVVFDYSQPKIDEILMEVRKLERLAAKSQAGLEEIAKTADRIVEPSDQI